MGITKSSPNKAGDNKQGIKSSGNSLSYWIDSVEPIKFEPLKKDLETEVLVIGAGISGISTAYALAKEGLRVVIIDDGFVGSGETGRTTAHLVSALDDFYTYIEKYHGEDGAKYAAESHTAAIDFIENVVKEENIDCDFIRLDGYLFLHPTDEAKTLEDELKATHRAGLKTKLLEDVPGINYEKGPSLQYPGQAQFHPLKYLKGLTDAIILMGGEIYTETRAKEIKEGMAIANGFKIAAKHIVVATNSPINNMLVMHTKQFPYRTYVVGLKIPKSKVKPALWWDTGDHNSKWLIMPYNYVRVQDFDAENYLLISGGADHKTGQADDEGIIEEERYAVLEEWARQRFPDAQEVAYRWSGQVVEPLDAMAYIGRNPGDKEIYIVTGDSGNGMTHGTIAALLLPDLIAGRENPWEKLYDPSRITLKAAGDYIGEMANMAAQYGDFLKGGDVGAAAEILAGEGAVISHGLKKYAVYRDQKGKLSAFTAVCPHLGCIVQWNGEEKSFDCPCHGSRFTCEGKVVNGPALSDLAKEISEKVE